LAADGWKATKVAGSLLTPRSVIFDTEGHLLVVESGRGISAHTLDGAGGCVSSSSLVVTQTNLNHGIALSPDGRTLYASSMAAVFSWPYDPQTRTVSGAATTIVAGMFNGGHPSRTLAIRSDRPDLLVISHGSLDNFDPASVDPMVGRALMKVFDISEVPAGGLNYTTDGYFMGIGLRNEVGIGFDGNNM
jgi:glucose/arabinose dehydrogenase